MQHRAILVPLDGSELAERALGPARQLARSIGAALVLVRSPPSARRRSACCGGALPLHEAARHDLSLDAFLAELGVAAEHA